MFRTHSHLAFAMLALALWLGVSGAASADDFYKGKTIRVVVGFAPGGGYDTYTRQIVRHMGKYIPGNPTFVVQNMTGAGSLIAANYTYNRAKRDGSVLGVWNSAFVLLDTLEDAKVKLKPKELGWLGAPVKGLPACGMMAWSGMTTLKEVLDSKKPIKMGGTRAGATGVDLPKILNKTIGTKFDVISGYSGTATIRLAMQAQEAEGACWGWESMRVTARSMLDAKGEGKFVPFLIHSKYNDPELKNAAITPDVIKKRGGKEGLALYNAWSGQYEFQRPMVAPPGVPKERLAMLRRAFEQTLKDPEFLKEANSSQLIINYVSPAEIFEQIEVIQNTPENAKEALGFLVKTKRKKMS